MGNRAALNKLLREQERINTQAWCQANLQAEEMKIIIDTARECAELADIQRRREAFPLH